MPTEGSRAAANEYATQHLTPPPPVYSAAVPTKLTAARRSRQLGHGGVVPEGAAGQQGRRGDRRECSPDAVALLPSSPFPRRRGVSSSAVLLAVDVGQAIVRGAPGAVGGEGAVYLLLTRKLHTRGGGGGGGGGEKKTSEKPEPNAVCGRVSFQVKKKRLAKRGEPGANHEHGQFRTHTRPAITML